MSNPYGRYGKSNEFNHLRSKLAVEEQTRQLAVGRLLNAGLPWLDCYDTVTKPGLALDLIDMITSPDQTKSDEDRVKSYLEGTLDLDEVGQNLTRKELRARVASLVEGQRPVNANELRIVVEQDEQSGMLISYVCELSPPLRLVG